METRVRGQAKAKGPLKYLRVLTDINNSYDDLYHTLEERIHCGLVNRARASGATKAAVAQASVLRSIEYAAVWANWSLGGLSETQQAIHRSTQDGSLEYAEPPSSGAFFKYFTADKARLELREKETQKASNSETRPTQRHSKAATSREQRS